jgi:hypothetical protein
MPSPGRALPLFYGDHIIKQKIPYDIVRARCIMIKPHFAQNLGYKAISLLMKLKAAELSTTLQSLHIR